MSKPQKTKSQSRVKPHFKASLTSTMKHTDQLAAAPVQSFCRALPSRAGPNQGDEPQAGFQCSVAQVAINFKKVVTSSRPLTVRASRAQRWCAVCSLPVHSCWDWREERWGRGNREEPLIHSFKSHLFSKKNKKHDCVKQPPAAINNFKHVNSVPCPAVVTLGLFSQFINPSQHFSTSSIHFVSGDWNSRVPSR